MISYLIKVPKQRRQCFSSEKLSNLFVRVKSFFFFVSNLNFMFACATVCVCFVNVTICGKSGETSLRYFPWHLRSKDFDNFRSHFILYLLLLKIFRCRQNVYVVTSQITTKSIRPNWQNDIVHSSHLVSVYLFMCRMRKTKRKFI